MIVEYPSTGETLFMQVRSSTGQAVLDDYVSRFDATPGISRLVLAVYTANRPDITL